MTSHTVFLSFIAVTMCAMNLSNASYLTLTADPPVIHPIITSKLQLRCSVKNNTIPNNAAPLSYLLLSNYTYPVELNTTQPPKNEQTPSMTQASDNNDRFLAITIMKVDEKSGLPEAVASVTGCEVPVIQRRFANKIKAEGSSEGSPEADEQGYLSLTWDYPDITDAGTYKCEASFLDHQKFSQTLRTSQDVPAKEPTPSDLVTYIAANSKYIAALEKQVQDLAKAKEELTVDINQIERNATSNQRLLTTDNIQTGTASCHNQFIYFHQAFRTEPIVFTSVTSMYFSSSAYNSQSFSVQVEEISNYGFRVNCTTTSYYTTASFDWLGIGA